MIYESKNIPHPVEIALWNLVSKGMSYCWARFHSTTQVTSTSNAKESTCTLTKNIESINKNIPKPLYISKYLHLALASIFNGI